MLIVASVIEVDELMCIGCKACDRVCPTEAIITVDKLAVVDESACTGCNKCIEACMDHGAINRKRLEKPVWIRVDLESQPEEKVAALCAGARLHPAQSICPCTGTRAREVAVAILNGATTPAEVTIQTGARGVCSMWCTSSVLRLLAAAGHSTEGNPKNWRLYPDGVGPSIWSIPDSVADKYPEYRLRESRDALKSGDLELVGFPNIRQESE